MTAGRTPSRRTYPQPTLTSADAFAALPDATLVVDGDGVVLKANRAFAERLGMAPEECVGRRCCGLVHGATVRPGRCPHAALLRDGREHTMEVEDPRLGGRILATATPLPRSDGDGDACILVFRDVTLQDRLQAQLLRRERYLEVLAEIERRLLECSYTQDVYDGILPLLLDTAGADRVYVFENRTGEDGRLVARQVAEAVAEGIEPQLHNPDLIDQPWDPLMSRWRQILAAGGMIHGAVAGFPPSERRILEPQGIQVVLLLPLTVLDTFFGFIGFDDCDGTKQWSDATVKLLGAAAGALSAALTRRRAMSSLWESKNKYKSLYRLLRSMADTVPDLIWAKDLERRYTFANAALCERLLHATDTDEPIGKTDLDFAERERAARPDDPEWHTFGEVCRDSDAIVMQSGRPGRFDESGNVRGEFLVLDVHKAPLHDDNGVMIGTVGSGRDVTEERHVAELLRQSEARMAALLAAVPDLLFRMRRDGTFLDAHAPDPAQFAVPHATIVGSGVHDVLPPQIAETTMQAIDAAFANGNAVTYEYPLEMHGDQRRYEARLVPCADDEVLAVVRDVTERYERQSQLKASARRLRSALLGTVKAMGTIVQLRDPYTAGHERNVTRIAGAIADELELDEDRRDGLMLAGEVHDIGKISIPAEILSKPGHLTAAEMDLVHQHPSLGRDILAGIDFEWPLAEIVYQHHERLDGSGYPEGLRGDEILLEARILAVADVMEAMAAHRPYRAALGPQAALDEISRGAGTLYDADVVAACVRAWEDGAFDFEA